jgi:hypothetical protein
MLELQPQPFRPALPPRLVFGWPVHNALSFLASMRAAYHRRSCHFILGATYVQRKRSVTCTTPGSRLDVTGKPLFSNTSSIGVLSGRTSATSS